MSAFRDGNGATVGNQKKPRPHDDSQPLPNRRIVTLANAFLEHAGDAGVFDDAQVELPPKLWHWRDSFYRWDGTSYRQLVDEVFRSEVNRFLDSQYVGRGEHSAALDAKPRLVGETVAKIAMLRQAYVDSMPAWLGKPHNRTHYPEPNDVIAFSNGLLFADEFVHEDGPFTVHHEPTQIWFSETAMPCRFDPTALCPLWLSFLKQALGDDEEGRELINQLQEWIGYCLTGDTSLQKMLWLHGRSGAGKSTLTKVLKRVVGERNSVSFRLPDLTKNFTFSAWLGKRLAVSEDASLSHDRQSIEIVEQIKAITGEDSRAVDRKHLEILANVRLSVRFVIVANQFPILPDASDALRRRSLIIPFEKSFDGQRDPRLADRLYSEVAGIAWWSLLGLRRLRQRGLFTTTKSGERMQERFSELNSPTLVFIRNCCEVAAMDDREENSDHMARWRVTKGDLYEAYAKWCVSEGHRAMGKNRFCEALLAAAPSVADCRPRTESEKLRPRSFQWIRLREGWAELIAHQHPSPATASGGQEEELPF